MGIDFGMEVMIGVKVDISELFEDSFCCADALDVGNKICESCGRAIDDDTNDYRTTPLGIALGFPKGVGDTSPGEIAEHLYNTSSSVEVMQWEGGEPLNYISGGTSNEVIIGVHIKFTDGVSVEEFQVTADEFLEATGTTDKVVKLYPMGWIG